MSQIKIVTTSGFSCEISENALDDMELLEMMGGLISNDATAIFKLPAMLERFIGKDGKDALYDHCRAEDGRVPTSAVIEEFTEMMNSLGGDKKKS